MARVIIVNDRDEIIGTKNRDQITSSDIYRVSALWITNSQGEILLAQRAFTKTHNSGKWGPAVAGTIEEGENYYSNIVKETEEEIGLIGIKIKEIGKFFYSSEWRYFSMWYSAVVDKNINEFKIQKEEVAQIKWFSREELSKDLKANPDKYLGAVKKYLETPSLIKEGAGGVQR
jgi:isopentenyldiphosphate isomerase